MGKTNGVPTGSLSPQSPSISTLIPNAHTLRLYPGDVLRVSISDPRRGLTTRITDLTTGQAGYLVASAANGFADTRIGDCSGRPWTYHAEYNTARSQNLLPWLGPVGPGPCTQLTLGRCKKPETEGVHGPVACPTRRASFKALCEFTGFPCAPRGTAHFSINGHKMAQIVPVSYGLPGTLSICRRAGRGTGSGQPGVA